MKKIIKNFIPIILVFSFSCKKANHNIEDTTASLQENANKPKTKVEFNKEIHDFGKIEQGEIVETTFTIKNIGENDLYIADAHGSCGCTVPEVTKDAIEPGKLAPITVTFDSNGKTGEVIKNVMITCNTEKTIENLKIKASIITKKQ